MDIIEILIILSAILIAIVFILFAVKNAKRMKNDAIVNLQDTLAKEQTTTISEEFNNVSLGVGSGIRFGFGFGIGLFCACIVITIMLTAFFKLTMSTLLSGLMN